MDGCRYSRTPRFHTQSGGILLTVLKRLPRRWTVGSANLTVLLGHDGLSDQQSVDLKTWSILWGHDVQTIEILKIAQPYNHSRFYQPLQGHPNLDSRTPLDRVRMPRGSVRGKLVRGWVPLSGIGCIAECAAGEPFGVPWCIQKCEVQDVPSPSCIAFVGCVGYCHHDHVRCNFRYLHWKRSMQRV